MKHESFMNRTIWHVSGIRHKCESIVSDRVAVDSIFTAGCLFCISSGTFGVVNYITYTVIMCSVKKIWGVLLLKPTMLTVISSEAQNFTV